MLDEASPIVGQLTGISTPTGTILGPAWDGRLFVILAYEEGKAQLAVAQRDDLRAAHARCEGEKDYRSFTELNIFGAVGMQKMSVEEQNRIIRTGRMQQVGKLHGVRNG